jgi:cation transport ATPase
MGVHVLEGDKHQINDLRRSRRTMVLLALDDEMSKAFWMGDAVRRNVREEVERISASGVRRIAMLNG